jgi:HEPN domain-containing protein
MIEPRGNLSRNGKFIHTGCIVARLSWSVKENEPMAISPEEWIRQADYDVDTAEIMCQSGRNFYAVFMCHLAVEKALKGVLHQRTGQPPPKGHHLIALSNQSGLKPPEKIAKFLLRLNEVDVTVRYPETLEKMAKDYPSKKVLDMLKSTKEAIVWIKAQLWI